MSDFTLDPEDAVETAPGFSNLLCVSISEGSSDPSTPPDLSPAESPSEQQSSSRQNEKGRKASSHSKASATPKASSSRSQPPFLHRQSLGTQPTSSSSSSQPKRPQIASSLRRDSSLLSHASVPPTLLAQATFAAPRGRPRSRGGGRPGGPAKEATPAPSLRARRAETATPTQQRRRSATREESVMSYAGAPSTSSTARAGSSSSSSRRDTSSPSVPRVVKTLSTPHYGGTLFTAATSSTRVRKSTANRYSPTPEVPKKRVERSRSVRDRSELKTPPQPKTRLKTPPPPPKTPSTFREMVPSLLNPRIKKEVAIFSLPSDINSKGARLFRHPSILGGTPSTTRATGTKAPRSRGRTPSTSSKTDEMKKEESSAERPKRTVDKAQPRHAQGVRGTQDLEGLSEIVGGGQKKPPMSQSTSKMDNTSKIDSDKAQPRRAQGGRETQDLEGLSDIVGEEQKKTSMSQRTSRLDDLIKADSDKAQRRRAQGGREPHDYNELDDIVGGEQKKTPMMSQRPSLLDQRKVDALEELQASSSKSLASPVATASPKIPKKYKHRVGVVDLMADGETILRAEESDEDEERMWMEERKREAEKEERRREAEKEERRREAEKEESKREAEKPEEEKLEEEAAAQQEQEASVFEADSIQIVRKRGRPRKDGITGPPVTTPKPPPSRPLLDPEESFPSSEPRRSGRMPTLTPKMAEFIPGERKSRLSQNAAPPLSPTPRGVGSQSVKVSPFPSSISSASTSGFPLISPTPTRLADPSSALGILQRMKTKILPPMRSPSPMRSPPPPILDRKSAGVQSPPPVVIGPNGEIIEKRRRGRPRKHQGASGGDLEGSETVTESDRETVEEQVAVNLGGREQEMHVEKKKKTGEEKKKEPADAESTVGRPEDVDEEKDDIKEIHNIIMQEMEEEAEMNGDNFQELLDDTANDYEMSATPELPPESFEHSGEMKRDQDAAPEATLQSSSEATVTTPSADQPASLSSGRLPRRSIQRPGRYNDYIAPVSTRRATVSGASPVKATARSRTGTIASETGETASKAEGVGNSGVAEVEVKKRRKRTKKDWQVEEGGEADVAAEDFVGERDEDGEDEKTEFDFEDDAEGSAEKQEKEAAPSKSTKGRRKKEKPRLVLRFPRAMLSGSRDSPTTPSGGVTTEATPTPSEATPTLTDKQQGRRTASGRFKKTDRATSILKSPVQKKQTRPQRYIRPPRPDLGKVELANGVIEDITLAVGSVMDRIIGEVCVDGITFKKTPAEKKTIARETALMNAYKKRKGDFSMYKRAVPAQREEPQLRRQRKAPKEYGDWEKELAPSMVESPAPPPTALRHGHALSSSAGSSRRGASVASSEAAVAAPRNTEQTPVVPKRKITVVDRVIGPDSQQKEKKKKKQKQKEPLEQISIENLLKKKKNFWGGQKPAEVISAVGDFFYKELFLDDELPRQKEEDEGDVDIEIDVEEGCEKQIAEENVEGILDPLGDTASKLAESIVNVLPRPLAPPREEEDEEVDTEREWDMLDLNLCLFPQPPKHRILVNDVLTIITGQLAVNRTNLIKEGDGRGAGVPIPGVHSRQRYVKGGADIVYSTYLHNAHRLRDKMLFFNEERRERCVWVHHVLIRLLPLDLLTVYLDLLRFAKTCSTRLLSILLDGMKEKVETEELTDYDDEPSESGVQPLNRDPSAKPRSLPKPASAECNPDDVIEGIRDSLEEFVDSRPKEPNTDLISASVDPKAWSDVLPIIVTPNLACPDSEFALKNKACDFAFRLIRYFMPESDTAKYIKMSAPLGDCTIIEIVDHNVDLVVAAVKNAVKNNTRKRVVLFGWGLTCYINHRVVQLIHGISAIVNFAFPMSSEYGYRGSPDDDILLTYCPTLFIVGTLAPDFCARAMFRLRENMIQPSGLVIVGDADENLCVSTLRLTKERMTQKMFTRVLLEQVSEFLSMPSNRLERAQLVPAVLNNIFNVNPAALKISDPPAHRAPASTAAAATSGVIAPPPTSGRRQPVERKKKRAPRMNPSVQYAMQAASAAKRMRTEDAVASSSRTLPFGVSSPLMMQPSSSSYSMARTASGTTPQALSSTPPVLQPVNALQEPGPSRAPLQQTSLVGPSRATTQSTTTLSAPSPSLSGPYTTPQMPAPQLSPSPFLQPDRPTTSSAPLDPASISLS